MGYYEATKIIDGPEIIETHRVEENGNNLKITTTIDDVNDRIFYYDPERATDGVTVSGADNPKEMKNVKPFLIDGILAYPTSDQYFETVVCIALVEDMSQEEKDAFKKKHAIELDPTVHSLVVYYVDAGDWSPDVEY